VHESPAAFASRTRWGVIEPVAPFRLDLTAWALRRRAHNEIDRFDGRAYRRALRVGNRTIALSVTQSGSVDIPIWRSRSPTDAQTNTPSAIARDALDRLLGLSIDLSGFAALAACDPVLDLLARELRGVKPPRFPTLFEAFINAVACQQLSLPSASICSTDSPLTTGAACQEILTGFTHSRPVKTSPPRNQSS
jgi:DNA-3-methyladenine glycosylase II